MSQDLLFFSCDYIRSIKNNHAYLSITRPLNHSTTVQPLLVFCFSSVHWFHHGLKSCSHIRGLVIIYSTGWSRGQKQLQDLRSEQLLQVRRH